MKQNLLKVIRQVESFENRDPKLLKDGLNFAVDGLVLGRLRHLILIKQRACLDRLSLILQVESIKSKEVVMNYPAGFSKVSGCVYAYQVPQNQK